MKRFSTSLAQILKDHGVNAVICAGIAYDICVYWTSLDAVEFGFKTAVAFEARYGFDVCSYLFIINFK